MDVLIWILAMSTIVLFFFWLQAIKAVDKERDKLRAAREQTQDWKIKSVKWAAKMLLKVEQLKRQQQLTDKQYLDYHQEYQEDFNQRFNQ